MPISTDSLNTRLYELLKVQGFDPIPKDSSGETTPIPDDADVFKFTYKQNGKEIGPAWITIDSNRQLKVYYDNKVLDTVKEDETLSSKSFYDFLAQLKKWAQRRQLGFVTVNQDRLAGDMAKREHMKKQEQVNEGYYPMGKSASYNDAVPTVKIILQHTRQIQEGEQRYRNVAKIFLENTQGERILAPTVKPGIAQIYARHLAEGGVPNDDRWNHIKGLCEEYTKMAGFVRAVRGNQFNESAQRLVEAGLNHYQSLRESLGKMRGHRGYTAYFESWTPTLMETEGDESTLNELFVQETLDPRIESVMPILNKLSKNLGEMKEVKALEEWADSLLEAPGDETLAHNQQTELKRMKALDLDEAMDPVKKRRLYDLIELFRDATDPSDYYDRDIEEPEEVLAMIGKEFGSKIADQVSSGAYKMHFPRHEIQRSDPLGWKKPVDRITKAGKMYKQDSDYMKNTIKSRYELSGKSATEGVEEGVADTLKKVGKKVVDYMAPSDEQSLKDLQKRMGMPQHAQHGKPSMAMPKDEVKEEEVEESGLQAYLGNKKYGKEGMDALRKAGREHASKEKMAQIRAKYDKLDEVDMLESNMSSAVSSLVANKNQAATEVNDAIISLNNLKGRLSHRDHQPKANEVYKTLHLITRYMNMYFLPLMALQRKAIQTGVGEFSSKDSGVKGVHQDEISRFRKELQQTPQQFLAKLTQLRDQYQAGSSDPQLGDYLENAVYVLQDYLQPMIKNVDDEALRKVMQSGQQGVAEDLDANQKRAGQLGPTEKVGPQGAVGKLVGANESIGNDELSQLKNLLKLI